uniref:Palladin n=1 Tax=Poecilia formosa TaxID=48698 RepID=A0A096MAK9_POEFO
MQDGSWNQPLPISVLLKDPAAGGTSEGDAGVFSEASSDGELYLDSSTELDSGHGDFADLTAFLSAEEINLSLDLAREAFGEADECEDQDPSSLKQLEQALQSVPSPLVVPSQTTENLNSSPNLHHQTKAVCPDDNGAVSVSSNQISPISKPVQISSEALSSAEKVVRHKPIQPVYKQDKPRLVHEGLELNDRAASVTEFCSRAATFIEELSSIFKGSAQQVEEESSSPDSGYLSPRSQQTVPPGLVSTSSLPPGQQEDAHNNLPEMGQGGSERHLHAGASAASEPLSPPQFLQKLKSQEVAEGSPIRLECRVQGNPLPLVRWFCEGRELQNSPDIQIWREGDLHTLVIAEAFEDDTGRYTCVASNSLGADNTSAEVYIEGASSSDSEGEGTASKSRSGAMPQAQKKTTSMSLTIRSSSPKTPEVPPHRSALVQSMSQPPQRMQSPVSALHGGEASGPPLFTKLLQDVQASEGQVVVLECRVRGSPPLQVQWYRQGNEILDSPDFRILQKKPRSAAESEEICTLVIAEAFPEDGGLFFCKASNAFGSVSSTAQLTVNPAAEDSSSNGMSGDSSGFEDAASFPPPPPPSPPPTEISLLELPPKALPQPGLDAFRVKELEMWPGASVPPLVQINSEVEDGDKGRGLEPLQNGQHPPTPPSLPKDAPLPPPPPPLPLSELAAADIQVMPSSQAHIVPDSPPSQGKLSPSPGKDGPPIPTKPKPKLQEVPPPPLQLLQEAPPPAPPSPPLQELESSTAMQASTFNYARPKQFIAAQSPGGAAYVAHSSGSSGSSLSSPLSPPASHKPLNRVALPPFTKAGSVESPTSPSFPPPPPPFLSPSNLSSPSGPGQDFPPPPPPPPPPVSMSPVGSDVSSPFSSVPPSPASSFLSSVLPSSPSTPGSPTVNSLGLPKGNGTIKVFPRKSSVTKTPRVVSDSDIQGSKDAVIQDLERKLRFKEERMSNGQQRLTYEEKMARRLLGADNAATVLNTQDTEEEPITQVRGPFTRGTCGIITGRQEYKVSSFEQRLISEIEYRLERSPMEESDDDVQHDEDSAGQGVAPSFDQKLKHYKVFEGMPVTFSCKVHGDPKPKVYWFKDGKQISKRSEHYRISRDPDGTCSLHTAAASLDDDGNYTILAANPDGRVSCTGRMMVQAVNQRGRSPRMAPGHMRSRKPRSRSRDSGDENDNIQERHFRPHFLQAPGDLIVQEGRLCRMDCKVSGLPTPDLIWQLNGHTIRPDSSHKMLVRENGVHSLVIEPVTSRDAGIYTCIASNRAGQNSFNLELIVAAKEMHKAPSFVEKLQNTSVAEGHPVRLECRVTGVPHPQIFWKRENESFTHNTDRISMHQDNCGYLCMIIQPALKEDAGWYTVSAKNDAGIVSSTARLDVHTQWQQPNLPKPKKVRPSASRYAALTERGLDVKAAFFPDSSPLPPGGLVESDDL